MKKNWKEYGHTIYVKLKPEIYEKLKLLAEKKDIPLATVARHIITEYINKEEKHNGEE